MSFPKPLLPPAFTIAESAQAYEWYLNNRPDPRLAKIGYHAMNWLIRPRVAYQDGAQEAIADLHKTPTRLIVTPNHDHNLNPIALAAMVHAEEVFQPILGHATIPSKDSLFKNPLLRSAVHSLGSVPVWQGYKTLQAKDGVGPSEEKIQLQNDASEHFLDCQAALIADLGQHMGIYVEGKRNKVNPRALLPFKTGLEQMLLRIPHTPVAIVPVGMSNGDPGNRHLLTPDVYVGMPIPLEPRQPRDGLTERLAPVLQHCVDLAYVASDARAA